MGNALGSPRPCSECFRKLTTSRRKPRLTRLEDVLIFFDRSDLERISLSSRQLRHIVVNYFYDSPYLLLDNACVMIIHKSFALLQFRGIHYGEYFHQHFDFKFGFPAKSYPKQICHIWTGQTLRIFSRTTYQDDIMNLRVRLAIDMLLSNSNLLRPMGNAMGSPRPCSECFRKLTPNRRKQRFTRLEDVLIFFDRSDLERISLSSRQLRHIVVNYFYDSPYLLLGNACVMIIHKSFALLKFRGIHYGEYFHQHTLNWIVLPDNSDWPQIEQEHLINIKDMYFPKWFRVDLAQIECSIFAEKPTEDAMDAYELICHIWTGQTLRIFSRTTYQDDIMNLRVRLASDMLLSNSNLLRVRELQYRAWDYVQQVYNYPLVYEANIVRVEATHRWNSLHMANLIEGKVLHPASPTIFVINLDVNFWSSSSDDDVAIQNMGELYTTLESNFDNATTPKSYVIVILDGNWPVDSESRRNNINEICRKINGGGEKFYHNYDQEWNEGDTCLLERFSIPSIL